MGTRAWLAVAATMFVVAWGGNEFTPLLVMYREDHGFSPVVVDVFLFAYVLGIVPGLLLGGPLSDRIGRRPVLIPAPFLTIAGSIVLAAGADSAALIVAGRILCGVALGLGMAVGGSWIAELSRMDPTIPPGAPARRAAMSLTAGFALGAGVAGVLAQWAPWPSGLSYSVHILLSVAAVAAVTRVPETRAARRDRGPLRDDLRIPAAGHRRFVFVVAPLAPWVFGSAAAAYAVLPAVMTSRTELPLAFSALMCVVGLGAGFLIQSLGRRIDDPRNSRGVLVALLFVIAGMVAAAIAATVLTVPVAIVASIVLGCGYGMALVSGLQEVQRIAGPDDLAGLTAVFYSLTYLGFATPAIMASLSETFAPVTYPVMFGFGAIAAAVCLVLVVVKWTAHLPQRGDQAKRVSGSGAA
ncbi:major facilitator superfamily multidrug [Rhodococcus rhodnii LMG 5362]|uniref:Major facilitator superfamily multidrug n=1 Tax=Rhodococcus rhodnii LMG 5362 TaxID=1273125 RepID=R7WSQ8_9NOCA|nr:major facilitator superfamily multidrug [Rhodococcus rhodnii LMG 5362]